MSKMHFFMRFDFDVEYSVWELVHLYRCALCWWKKLHLVNVIDMSREIIMKFVLIIKMYMYEVGGSISHQFSQCWFFFSFLYAYILHKCRYKEGCIYNVP